MKFVDEVTITVASGNGGPGCVSFRRESMVPRGGPDGGDGGSGGNVRFVVNPQLGSLLDFRYKRTYRASNGQPGRGANMHGKDGEDLTLEVPPGTVIKDAEGGLISDLGREQEFVFLKGGQGGRGNAFFKSSINQAPQRAQKGLPGQEASVKLELKLLADVGIIGFPNVGKSTLISRISAAKPKVADYPFTTLIPNLGVVRVGENRTLVVADIPGLIADAHKGVGLGIQFLRHIQRTRVFVHVIDVSEVTQREPYQDYVDINSELKAYDEINVQEQGFEPLAGREQIVVLNKVDAVSEERLREVIGNFKKHGVEVLPVSAVSGKNVQELIYKMGKAVFKNDEE